MDERSTTERMSTDGPGSGGPPSNGRCLSAEGFAARFQASARTLWTIAAGVLGSRSQAEDVLQEAAVIALRKLEQFDPETSFTAWMGCIVRNVALNVARKAKRQATPATDPELLDELWAGAGAVPRGAGGSAPAPDPRLPIDERGELLEGQGDFDDRVLRALRRLEPPARAALLLRTILGLEYGEIASVLDIPAGTAMSHVHRCRQTLRQSLGGSPKRPIELERET